MALAAALGLPVATAEPRVVGGRPYLLVTRYDRRIDEGGIAHRLHQEDFCQALGIPGAQVRVGGRPHVHDERRPASPRRDETRGRGPGVLRCRHLQPDRGQRRCARQELRNTTEGDHAGRFRPPRARRAARFLGPQQRHPRQPAAAGARRRPGPQPGAGQSDSEAAVRAHPLLPLVLRAEGRARGGHSTAARRVAIRDQPGRGSSRS